MATIGTRELSRRTSTVVAHVEETREPVVVTRHGRAAVVIVPADAQDIEDFVLSRAAEFTTAMHNADRELAAGETKSLEEVLAELD